VRACTNCGSPIYHDTRELRYLCEPCATALVMDAEREAAESHVSYKSAMKWREEMLKEGHHFTHSALSAKLIWDRPGSHHLRRIRERYVRDGNFERFLRDMDKAIKLYKLDSDDLH
jgi:hypothetical protein